MARPYQDRVDQFLAGYQDKFLPSLVTGKETPMTKPGVSPPVMTKEQAQLERDRLIHPDTFSKVLSLFGPRSAYAGDREQAIPVGDNRYTFPSWGGKPAASMEGLPAGPPDLWRDIKQLGGMIGEHWKSVV